METQQAQRCVREGYDQPEGICSAEPESMIMGQVLICACLGPSSTMHSNRFAMTGYTGGRQWEGTCSAEPESMIMGQVLICAWLSPAMPCTAPGPDTVSSTPGTPVKKPQAAAA